MLDGEAVIAHNRGAEGLDCPWNVPRHKYKDLKDQAARIVQAPYSPSRWRLNISLPHTAMQGKLTLALAARTDSIVAGWSTVATPPFLRCYQKI